MRKTQISSTVPKARAPSPLPSRQHRVVELIDMAKGVRRPRTFPTAASPSSTSLTLLLGFGCDDASAIAGLSMNTCAGYDIRDEVVASIRAKDVGCRGVRSSVAGRQFDAVAFVHGRLRMERARHSALSLFRGLSKRSFHLYHLALTISPTLKIATIRPIYRPRVDWFLDLFC